MRHKRVVSILIVFLMMINMLVITASAENEIKLIIDGQERSLSREIYLSGDGTVYVPLIETLTYLGIDITKNYDNTYIGAGANGEVFIEKTSPLLAFSTSAHRVIKNSFLYLTFQVDML